MSATLATRRAFIDRAYKAMGVTAPVQALQRVAVVGISLMQAGHVRNVGSSSTALGEMRLLRAFIGVTTQKYTTEATAKNEIKALKK